MSVTVSVRPENNNNSVLIVDQLPKQPTHINHTRPHTYQHTIRELTSDTRYHVCVEARQWGGVEGAGPGEEVILQGGCYSVKTLPQVDNISGLYASLAAVGSFLVVVMVGWVLYVMVWGKWLSKLLPNKDKYEVERPAEGQPNPAYTTTQIITNT
ncbi:hypothetical protein Pmani_002517 [Petrolisthes manimaculis]|uniref:Uncharacterized protein n=1 Tax=Petrolisthes manimaculis TaxID=1843537 RepID=A0AAE1QI85_9EUCA|nr:hypothetical protein Pmani_002517 [Petrolisthes manimaculis]